MNWMALVLLLICLVGLGAMVRRDRAEYERFKALTESRDRRRYFRKWVIKSFLRFTGATVVGLALLGRLAGYAAPPPEFRQALVTQLTDLIPIEDLLTNGFLVGFVAAVAVVSALAVLAARPSKAKPKTVVIGDVLPLMPRNWAETAHTALLSLNAGLSEELFFRALLPLLLVLVTGQPLMSLLLAALIFGLMHAYQGWLGVVVTTVLGLVFTVIFLVSGNLWVAIALHAALDLMALVVRPSITRLRKPRTA